MPPTRSVPQSIRALRDPRRWPQIDYLPNDQPPIFLQACMERVRVGDAKLRSLARNKRDVVPRTQRQSCVSRANGASIISPYPQLDRHRAVVATLARQVADGGTGLRAVGRVRHGDADLGTENAQMHGECRATETASSSLWVRTEISLVIVALRVFSGTIPFLVCRDTGGNLLSL